VHVGPRILAWEYVVAMEEWISPEGTLVLPAEDRAEVQSVALQVAIAEAEAYTSLRSPEGTASLVREIRRRAHDGGKRYSSALDDVLDLKAEDDLAGARRVLEEYISLEPIPKYRELATAELRDLE
jgi:DUSAM domain-containing protein